MPNDPLTKQDVFRTIAEHRAQLRALGVSRLGLFGSFLHERQRANSDVDLLVEFTSGQKTYDNFLDLAELLEALLGRRVDLLTPESLSPHIGPHILRDVEYARVA